MEIQPPRRRAAQAIGVVVMIAGALMLATSLAFLFGLILEIERRRRGLLPDLAMGLLGVILIVLGRRLLAWGSGDRS
jgi:hypothetical protein